MDITESDVGDASVAKLKEAIRQQPPTTSGDDLIRWAIANAVNAFHVTQDTWAYCGECEVQYLVGWVEPDRPGLQPLYCNHCPFCGEL